MKIQHWAIIFLIIIIPFSIVCRNVISKKMLNLRDETRYNNIVDNACYDAVAQLQELSNKDKFGKKMSITDGVAEATVDRFFNTLSVNFNLPMDRDTSEAYFDRYIPAIIIVGYDGLYVYSCENVNGEYKFTFKPKIPYTETIEYKTGEYCIINYTLDNYVKLYFPNITFGESYYTNMLPADNSTGMGTHQIDGYVGVDIDSDQDGIPDFLENFNDINASGGEKPTLDPFNIRPNVMRSGKDLDKYVQDNLSTMYNEVELSYYLFEMAGNGIIDGEKIRFLIDEGPNGVVSKHRHGTNLSEHPSLASFYSDNTDKDDQAKILGLSFSPVNIDYQFDDNGKIISDASPFHIRRREVIINTIVSVMREEFNEHNSYAKTLGITYNFNIPNIGRDEWNNTIDDVTVVAFMQGMPVGTDSYYNNYSLGAARMVLKKNIFGEIVYGVSASSEGTAGTKLHAVYHNSFCKCLIGNKASASLANDGYVFVGGINQNNIPPSFDRKLRSSTEAVQKVSDFMRKPDNTYEMPANANKGSMGSDVKFYHVKYKSGVTGEEVEKYTTGIVREFLSPSDAESSGYFACTECF